MRPGHHTEVRGDTRNGVAVVCKTEVAHASAAAGQITTIEQKKWWEWRRGLLAVGFQNHAASLADSFALGFQALQNAEIIRDLVSAEAVRVRGAGGLLFRCTNKDKASRKNYRCVALSKNGRRTEC
jgi:hypothetical protein